MRGSSTISVQWSILGDRFEQRETSANVSNRESGFGRYGGDRTGRMVEHGKELESLRDCAVGLNDRMEEGSFEFKMSLASLPQ